MARPSKEFELTMDWEILARRREAYTGIPDRVALLTAFCDVQDSWLEWGVIGWGEGTENWMIEHEVIIGDPSKRGVWDDLAVLVSKHRTLPLDWTFIDYGGHHGQESIDFVKRMGSHRVYLCRGSNQNLAPVNHKITKTKKPIVRLFETGVGNAKRKIFSMLKESESGPGYCHFPDWTDDEFFMQLCAEGLKPKYIKGAEVYEWHQLRPRNEMFDIYVGCYAGLCRLNQGTVRRRMAEMRKRLENGEKQGDEKTETRKPRRPARRQSNWVKNY